MSSMPLSNFDAVVEQLLAWVRTSKQDSAVMHSCLKELDKIMKGLDRRWRVRPFGSAANGFCTRFSDLDVTCFQEQDDKEPGVTSASEAISRLHPIFQQHESFEVLELITAARIPLIKTRFMQKLEVDISFQNTDPLANTQLLRAYAELNILVRHVAILVKLWAKAAGVCGAQDGHLSSYSLTLMVIYCLQIDEYVKLPCLPTEAYAGGVKRPELPKMKWTCELRLPDLLCRFFNFYATDFHWGYEVVSPRLGRRLYASDECFSKLAGRESFTMVHIEDPYLLGRNLNCVLGQTQLHLFMTKICEANVALLRRQVPIGFWVALNPLHSFSKEPGVEQKLQESQSQATEENRVQVPEARRRAFEIKLPEENRSSTTTTTNIEPSAIEKRSKVRSCTESTKSGSSTDSFGTSSSESLQIDSDVLARKCPAPPDIDHVILASREGVSNESPSAADVPVTSSLFKLGRASEEPELTDGMTWSL